jgi:hypothetical protein
MLHATGGSRRYNLHAALQPLSANYMRQAASRMQTLHALAASTVQRHQFFERTLQEQFFELKNEDAIKKSENHVLAKAYPLTL